MLQHAVHATRHLHPRHPFGPGGMQPPRRMPPHGGGHGGTLVPDRPRLDASTLEELRSLAAVRPGLLESLVRRFVQQGERMFADAGGQLAAGDIEPVRQAFHTLKAGARSLGALRLGDLAEAVEHACAGTAPAGEIAALAEAARREFIDAGKELEFHAHD